MKKSAWRAVLAVGTLSVIACQPPIGDEGQEDGTSRVGTYTYDDGAHSFVPCGSRTVYPVVPGNAKADLIARAQQEGGPVVLRLRTRTVVAPAAEGAGDDEYLEVLTVEGKANCP